MSPDFFSRNYFEIFNVPVSYEVDLDKLGKVFLELQKNTHPDRYASSSDQEKRIAMQQTSLINQAFQILKNPVSRAQYMLKLAGIDMDSETDTTMDAEFLMEQMEFRESIAEVGNNEDPLTELDSMSAELKNRMNLLMNDFSESYTDTSYQAAREIVRKMQFITKAMKEVVELTEKFENELM